MLATGTGLLVEATRNGRAVAGFSTYNLETTQAICAAAEALQLPVIIQAGASAFGYAGRDDLAGLALQLACRASVPVGVHLDHSRKIEEIRHCIAAGYTSVMVDGSHLDFDANVAFTRQVVEEGHAAGVWVEGELGALAGDEDVSRDPDPYIDMTDPEQAAEFAAATGVDALAVAVGNVHGFTSRPVVLDLARLAQIHDLCPVPLVLHGASGLPDDVITAALRRGVAKVNVNAELRQAFFDAVSGSLPGARPGLDFGALLGPARTAVQQVAEQKIALLAGLSAAAEGVA